MKSEIGTPRARTWLARMAWTLLPLVAWGALFHFRPSVTGLVCAQSPASCRADQVFFLDRITLGLGNGKADGASFVTQDLSGALGALVPLAWLAWLAFSGALTLAGAFSAWAMELILLVRSAAWNGVLCELMRVLVQRPRPFVYSDPLRLGADAAHYTSFYSGHTSFSAATLTSMVLSLVALRAPRAWVRLGAATGVVMVFLTGLFRVLAGRHFITDVVAGAAFGALSAYCVHRWSDRRRA